MIRIIALLVTLSVLVVLAAPTALRLTGGGASGVDALMQAGRDKADAGDWVAARLRYEQVLSSDPDNLAARLGLARALRDGALFELSATHLLYIIDKDPELASARIELAEMLFMAGHLDESRMHLDSVLDRVSDPEPRVLALHAAHAASGGDMALAADLATAALEADPGLSHAYATLAAVALRSDDLDTAIGALDAARAAGAGTLSQGLMRLGLLERLGRIDEIGPELDALVAAHPDTPDLRLAQARWILARQPDRAKAARDILGDLVQERSGDTAMLVTLTGQIAEMLGPDEALDLFRRAANMPDADGAFEAQIAVLERASGDPEAARARLARQIDTAPTATARTEARLLLARLLDPVADWAARVDLAAAVLEDDPQNPSAHLLLADAQSRRGAQEQAISHLRTVLSVRPDDVETLMALARAHALAGSRELALDRLSKAVQVSHYRPGIALAYARLIEERQGPAAAAGQIDAALQAHPADSDLLTRRAALALATGDVSTAIEVRSRLADGAGERETLAALDLAIAAQSGGLGDQLEQMASDASADGQIMRARGTLRAGQPAEAAAILTGLLETQPRSVEAFLVRADAMLAQGDGEAALADLARAADLAPGRADIHATLVRLHLGMGRPDAADVALDAGLSQSPRDYELRVLKAHRLDSTGQSDAARAAFDRLSREQPGDPRVAFRLARLLAAPGAAAGEVERAVQLTAAFAPERTAEDGAIRGWVLVRSGSVQDGLALLRDAASQRPEDAASQIMLGLAEREAGHVEASLAALSVALDLAVSGATAVGPAYLSAARAAYDTLIETVQSTRSN